ncbi:MAG: group III truncated hemoglobin, partial [Planctomycetota bacterium]
VFVDLAQVDWAEHLPKIAAFWCQLELGIRGFQGNPTQKHHQWSERSPFRADQFARWVALFHDTIDRNWAGPRAESIKARAVMIAKAQSRMVPSAEEWTGPEPA